MLNTSPDLWERVEPDPELAGHSHGSAHYVRLDCRPAMQNHLRQKFLDAQGPSMKDSTARLRRIENARRYVKWANAATLSSTGQRSI